MSAIGGQKRENTGEGDFKKHVGLFEATVIAVNPTTEQFKDVLEIELKEDSKAAEYIGESKDGNTYLRVDFWLKEVKNDHKFKVSFFLEDRERENKDGTKKQYINNIGNCAWADDPNNLPEWFVKREYRVAYSGEEDLYTFMRTWLSELDYRHADTTLMLEWKKLMKGNVKDIKDQINGEWSNNVGALATIITRQKEDEVVEYQNVYNKGFLSPYSLKNFKLVDYSSTKIIEGLRAKKSKDLKPHERFVLNITGEYGCKDYYTFKELAEYDSSDNLAASDETLSKGDDDSDY
jgi:hypothetical protein